MTREPIRVAQVIGKLNAAGVEAVVNNYYRNIDRTKYQFDYYIEADGACQPPQELIDLGARYFVIPPCQRLPQYIRALVKRFRENSYPIVHSGMNTLAVFSLFAAWAAGSPVRINHNHSTANRGETKRNLLKYALRPFAKLFATHYCACSRYAGQWLFGKRSVEAGKVAVFNNAIDTERFRFDPQAREATRRELGLENTLVLGHVGRFCYQKNQEFLIELLAEVRKSRPEAVLVLIGIGKTEEAIRRMADELELREAVLFLSARPDVERLYQAMDVFVFPSRYEGLGLAAVEAQCAGLPVLASDNVPREAQVTDRIRFLRLEDGVSAWAGAINDLPAADRVCRIDDRFDIRREAKKLEEFYDAALAQAGRRG